MMLLDTLRQYDIILASQSPRRKALLEGMGLEFRVVPVGIDEVIPDSVPPAEVAELLAGQKADHFPSEELRDDSILITADTIVVSGTEILGKPADRQEAINMINSLAGREHDVITGVCLKYRSVKHCFHAASHVSFKMIPPEEVEYYVDHFQPYDKAGAYGIQEWIGYTAVDHIDGSYFNVMGLPTLRLWEELRSFLFLQFKHEYE